MVIRDTIKAKRHPTGPGSTGSWRGDAKAKIPIVGKKGTTDYAEQARNHQSAPLTTLKDPDSFGPPPKHIHYHGAVASPSAITPDTRGWGAPLPTEQVRAITQGNERLQKAEAEPPKPSGPFRIDTTGLSTTGLPKPPTHRALLESNEPVDTGLWKAPPSTSSKPLSPTTQQAKPPARPAAYQPQPQAKPQPPPRLPPRQNSHPDVHAPDPPPSYRASPESQPNSFHPASLNGNSVDRLSQAGVSVPGFGIGQQQSNSTSSVSKAGNPSQMSELQSRFARLNSNAENKQLSQGGNISSHQQAAVPVAAPPLNTATAAALAAKKAPPPPPKKKTGIGNIHEYEDAPPPIPLSTKPTF